MKLSIITVNLNDCNGLLTTMNSITQQTFHDYEWIVIDGGSTDGSKQFIEEHADLISYWVSEPDSGIYNAMNKAVRHAQGEYSLFLNSGDWLWEESALENVFAENPHADVVYGDIALISETEPTSIRTYSDRLSFNALYRLSICHQSSFIRTELLREEPYDETLRIVADWKFFIRKALARKTFLHVNTTVAAFCLTGISSSNPTVVTAERERVSAEEIPDCLLADDIIINELKQNQPDHQMMALQALRSKNRFNHKMVTALIKFLTLIDKLTGHDGDD